MLTYDYVRKVVVVGPVCGKSSFLSCLVHGKFTQNYVPTIGVDFNIKTIVVQNKTFKLQIWDTSGLKRFRGITNSYYTGATGIVLCFDLTNKQTFKEINAILKDIKQHSNMFKRVRIVLIGCKCDLIDKIVVNNSQINQFINNAFLKYGKTIEYFETSAKFNMNVKEAFEFMCNFMFDENYPQIKRLSKVNLEFLMTYFVRNCKINGMYQWFKGINGIIKNYLCKGY